ncbi:MAG: hypothetical protein AB7O62_17500 [Pirellulales bacterium]
MFRSPSSVRRLACRASFLLLCVLPTLGVGAWIVVWRLPSHRRDYERAIGYELGLEVRLEEAAHPRPGLTVLKGLRATEQETGQVVLQADEIKAASNGVGLVVVAAGAKIDAAALAEVWQAAERALSRRPAEPSSPVRILANELFLQWPDRQVALSSVVGRIETLDAGPQASMEWRTAETSTVQSPRITLFRDRQGGLPRAGFELDTGDAPLDLSLLSPAVPVEEWIGPRARFHGYVWARRGEHGWNGLLRGELADIDLATLVANHVPHDLRGSARVQVYEAQFRESRLVDAAGLIEGGPGFVSQSFLQAIADSLQMSTRARDGEFPRAILPFDLLAAEFSLGAEGLSLTGRCHDQPAGTVIADGRKSMLDEPASQPQPIAGLAKLFATPNDPVVPLNPYARGLLDLLPGQPVREQRRTADRFQRDENSDPPRLDDERP